MTAAEWDAVTLSIMAAGWGMAAGLPPAVAVAYLLARWHSRWKWPVEVLVNLPLVLPPVVTGYLLLLAFGRQGPLGRFFDSLFGVRIVFTWQAAALAAGVVGFPLMVRAMRLAFLQVNPRLELGARSLGASRLATFFRVSLPLAWRGVAAGAVLSFARGLGEFGATIMIAGNIPGITRTIPLAIFAQVQRPGGMAASLRLALLSVLIACGALLCSEWLEERERRRHA